MGSLKFTWDPKKHRATFASTTWTSGRGCWCSTIRGIWVEHDRIDEYGEERLHAIGTLPTGVVLLVVHIERGQDEMAKKSGTSSRPERLITVNSKDIFNKPLSKRMQAVTDRMAAEQAAGDFSNINYEDAPSLTEEQLAAQPAFWAARLAQGRPRRPAKISVSFRLDPAVLDWLKAKGNGAGHLTLINDILLNVMEAEQQAASNSTKAEPRVGAK